MKKYKLIIYAVCIILLGAIVTLSLLKGKSISSLWENTNENIVSSTDISSENAEQTILNLDTPSSTGAAAKNIVEYASLYDTCINEFGPDDYERVTCLLPFFEEITASKGTEIAINTAKELKAQDLINDCHLPSHAVGHATMKQHGDKLAQAFVSCPLGCFEGCFHGVIEGYADQVGDIDNLITATNIPDICAGIGDERKFKLHCVHGIGHGLMRHGGAEIVVEKLDVCQLLTDIDYRSGCFSGVIMEYINTFLWYPEEKLKTELPKICNPIANSSAHNDLMWLCMQEISDGLMAYTGDLAKAEEFCSVLVADLARQCKEGVVQSRHNPQDKLHNVIDTR